MRDLCSTGQPINRGLGQWPEICSPSLQPHWEMPAHAPENFVKWWQYGSVSVKMPLSCMRQHPVLLTPSKRIRNLPDSASEVHQIQHLGTSWHLPLLSTPLTLGDVDPQKSTEEGDQCRDAVIPHSSFLSIPFHLHLLKVQPQPCCLSSSRVCSASFRCKLGLAQQPFKHGCYWNRPLSQVCFSPRQTEMMAFLVTSQQRGASAIR